MHRPTLLALVLVACRREPVPEQAPPSTPPAGDRQAEIKGLTGPAAAARVRLFSDAERAALPAPLEARLATNRTRTCPRPPLRGATTAGPAAPELVGLVEPSGALDACLAEAAKVVGGGKLVELVQRRDPAIVAVAARCAPTLEPLVTAIGAHADACSPYLPGARPEPGSALSALRLGQLLSLRVALASDGDPARALWLAADGVRAFQDLARGPTSLILSMIGVAAVHRLLDEAGAVLARGALPPAAAPALAAAFDALLATEQGFGVTLQGEADVMALAFAPSQGSPAGTPPPPGASVDAVANAGLDLDPADTAALMLAMSARVRAELATACPEVASLAGCARGLDALTATVPAPALDGKAMLARVAAAASGASGPDALERVRREVQGGVVDTLVAVSAPTYRPYVGKRAAMVAHLAAIRLALEVARTRRCPTAAELTAPPYAALIAPAALGDPVVVTIAATGAPPQLEVAPPAWANARQPASWTIRCP